VTESIEQVRFFIEQLVASLGYPGIALVMLVENLFPPIPSELVMPLAGFMTRRDEFNFIGVVASGTLGAVTGALILYHLGSRFPEERLRSFLRRYGRWLLLFEADLDRALALFERYDKAVVFFARFMPGLRSLISLPAGLRRMPLASFVLFTTLGTVIYNSIMSYAGVLLGSNWERVLSFVERYQILVVIVAATLVAAFIVTRLREKHLARSTAG
jgi:membrane protein DedA with SNARE-associated domain